MRHLDGQRKLAPDRRWRRTLVSTTIVASALLVLSSCTIAVDLEVENQCDTGLYAYVSYSPFDAYSRTDHPHWVDKDSKRILPGHVVTLDADVFYDTGYLWVKAADGEWGYEQIFVIDPDSDEPSRIIIAGDTCEILQVNVEPSPSPSTSPTP